VNNKWYQSKKLWLAVIGQIPVLLAVILPLVCGLDKTLAATLSSSLGIMLEAVVLALLGAHAYTDAAATKAKIMADAARAVQPVDPPASGLA